nr:DUF2069 domain-containing protein [Wenzhouxiangella sp. XN79A]
MLLPVAVARWTWLALIVLQLVWFGWLYPAAILGYWPALVIATVPLLLPAPWVLALKPNGLVIGGTVLLLHFSFAVGEAWANPTVRVIAWVQIVLVVLYFLALPRPGRRRKTSDGAQ